MLTIPAFPTDLSAPGAVEQLLRAHRTVFGDIRMEETGGDNGDPGNSGDGGTGGDASSGSGGNGQSGQGEGQSLEDVVANLGLTPEQVAGRLEASAKWERRAKSNDRVDRQDYERVVKERDDLKQANETATEKTVREAREDGANQARTEQQQTTLATAARIALRSQDVTDEDIDAFVAETNLSAFVTDDGQVDDKRLMARVERYAGTAGANNNAGPDMGQGDRGKHRTAPGAGGAAEADRRFGNNA